MKKNYKELLVNLQGYEELKTVGIILLTGEIDPYGFRVLVDLTEEAAQTIKEFLGVRDMVLDKNWNCSDGQKHSMVLSRSMLKDLILFILFHKFQCVAALPSYSGIGYNGYMDEDLVRSCVDHSMSGDLVWNMNRKNQQREEEVHNFNTHQFSGRIQAS